MLNRHDTGYIETAPVYTGSSWSVPADWITAGFYLTNDIVYEASNHMLVLLTGNIDATGGGSDTRSRFALYKDGIRGN